MEKEEQVGGDIYNTEKEAASEKTQEIRKSGDEADRLRNRWEGSRQSGETRQREDDGTRSE